MEERDFGAVGGRRPVTTGGDTGSKQSFGTVPPRIDLPRGGGSIRGIGEKFAANPVTGTASMSVPIATSPGRSGFTPELSLSYDSGAGNGPFGFGWSLSLQSITRKTDKGLPLYSDADDSDVYLLSGTEDLVPAYRQDPDGSWVAAHAGHRRDPVGHWVRDGAGSLLIHEDVVEGFRVRRYRPRTEGLFARIERWTRLDGSGDCHWRSISSDNILTVYGCDANSRIADPKDPRRIFSYLICETRDDKGNGLFYRYKAEDGEGVDPAKAHERNRGAMGDPRRTANRYLKRIHYGNRVPLLDSDGRRPHFLDQARIDAQISGGDWMFEIVLDYGEHRGAAPLPAETGEWAHRPDPFSSYRSGFEIRTTRLCRRVLVFHHFIGETGIGRDCLVRSTDLTYSDELDPTNARNPVYAFLRSVAQTGYRRSPGGYDKLSLPPVEFEYSEPIVQNVVEYVDPASLEDLPAGLDGSVYLWTDLHGEGISGILTEQAEGWFYKRNISPIPERLPDGGEAATARFAAFESVALKPAASLRHGAELMDLAGDGQPDIVDLHGPVPGLYEHDEAEGWQPFRPFHSLPNRDLRDANLRFIDLDGDGHADLLVTGDDAFVWHPSLGEEGFGPARRVVQAADEEAGPRIVFADAAQSIYIADLSGDGLSDLLRIRNGDICYWPNLGHGRFGAKVVMDNAPWFDAPERFDHKRLRLADIDGSGTTDLIYLHSDEVRLYFNQSGNSWGPPQRLKVFPRVDDVVSVIPIDLLGNGTACLVWSSPLPGDSSRQMRYVNLMGGSKPHLLVGMVNNLGAETRVAYAPSSRFYLRDRNDGKPWVTRLPFPVHVVEKVETIDHLSRNRFVSRYAYHHGYFDGEEREFRGFGMVEQWDSEQIEVLAGGGAADNIEAASHVPPIHSKTWFHTGMYFGRDRVADRFAGLLDATDKGDYFREPGLDDAEARALLLPDTIFPENLAGDEEREAARALKGAMLRQEIYADDAGPEAGEDALRRALTPFSVTEHNFSIRAVQPRGGNRHGIFFRHARERLTYHYERDPADPRVEHSLTLDVDSYGNVLKQARIGYGRRGTIRIVSAAGQVTQVANPGLEALHPADRVRQTRALLTYTEKRVTNAVEAADAHRAPLPCEILAYELTGYAASGPAGRFQPADLVERDPAGAVRHSFADEVVYEAAPTGNPCRRLIEHQRTLYRSSDLGGLLPLGRMASLALPGESYTLAFTPGLLAQVFQRPRADQADEALLPVPAAVLGGEGGDRGGYLPSQALKSAGLFPAGDADDHWWLPAGRSFFTANPADPAAFELAAARQHFFLPRRYRDPFGHDHFVDFDANDLLMIETRDAIGNPQTVEQNDYRVLQPRRVRDPNGNRTEVAFDLLGMVAGTALRGKAQPALAQGDSLTGFDADLTQAERNAFFDSADPRTAAAALLRDATTRLVYDLDRFRRTRDAAPDKPASWQPACAATLRRETHASEPLPPEGLKIQLEFLYSDGFGRQIQIKKQAAPGPVTEGGPVADPRWVGDGWTVFNNKGKPVRQYEPFFSATHGFEFGIVAGVSPILFYDPADRAIATLHPNHSFEKIVFDAWQRTSYDSNDTCAPLHDQTGDPRTDPDIKAYVAAYFEALGPGAAAWQTWHERRIGGALGPDERDAATRAAAHADTPETAHFDALGRPFLTVARNRTICPGHDLDGTEQSLSTRVEIDIQDNQRAIRDSVEQGDPLGRIVATYDYDLLGTRIHERSMESGARWIVNDVAGNTIRSWDSRGHNFTTSHDVLRRPVDLTVRGTGPDSDPGTLDTDVLVHKCDYGESLADAASLNLRTRIFRQFDSAGLVTNARLDATGRPVAAYDFKGNLLHSTRRLLKDHAAIPDWHSDPALEDETFEGSTRYDALDRPVQSIAPRSSLARATVHVVQPVFDAGGLLERTDLWLERGTEPAGLLDAAGDAPSPVGISGISYDPKGQRRLIRYKNGAATRYRYDPDTFRLVRLYTIRGAGFTEDCNNPQPPPATMAAPETPPDGTACGLQNLRYVYDPAGNVIRISDDAQQVVYFRNRRVEPGNDYVYDALYRLIQATGREHLGQNNGLANPPSAADAFDAFHGRLDHPGDGNAMGNYVERFVHDNAGNFLAVQHRGANPAHPGWTRSYHYDEASLIEDGADAAPLKTGNRLTRTTLGPSGANPIAEPCLHDRHGNMIRMPHLGGGPLAPNLHWDYQDRLRRCDLGGGGTAYHVYDASGERIRKIWEKSPALIEERIYLGGFEIFRRHGGPVGAASATLERETLHVMDDKSRIALVERRTLDVAGTDAGPAELIRYQVGNHLASASLELDDRARIISFEEYAPYGSTTYQAVRSQTETPKRYRYAGRERDEETGLSCHGARYYATWLGRWTSADPSGLGDGPNLYQYARGNPIALVDLDGNQAELALTPQNVAVAATALQRAAQAWGTAFTVGAQSAVVAAPLAVAEGAVASAPVVAPAALTAGHLAIAGSAVAAQAFAVAAMVLTVNLHMQRSAAIVRYGNPWVPRSEFYPVLREVKRLQSEPFPVPEPAPKPEPDKDKRKSRPGRVYATYTKYNTKTQRYYSGRTSMVIDLNLPWEAQADAAVALRDSNHHVDENDEPKNPAFEPAVLEQFTVGYAVDYAERYRDLGYSAIRGREQQLIDSLGAKRAKELGIKDFSGGAQSDTNPGTPLTENRDRGVAKDNQLGEVFHAASNLVFRPLAPYTGNPARR